MLSRVDRPSAYARAMIHDEVSRWTKGRRLRLGGRVRDGHASTGAGKGRGRNVLVAGRVGRCTRRERMYLQVAQDNGAALGLYERSGFSELCGYHYRVATSG